MPYCHPCDRHFSENGYNQHMNTAAAHRYQWDSDPDNDWLCDYDNCSRGFATQHARDQHHEKAAGHPYCTPCKRMFQNENNLRQHQHSRTHMGNSIACPFCKNTFTTASGVTIHLESGTCTASGLNRTKINTLVQNLDRNNIITRPMLTLPGHTSIETIATERSWNPQTRSYQCYLCGNGFSSLNGLNNHIKSPVHEQPLYRCPKASCGKPFRMLSALVQHVESESCGLMRFAQVQAQARNGVQNMVGRMIMG